MFNITRTVAAASSTLEQVTIHDASSCSTRKKRSRRRRKPKSRSKVEPIASEKQNKQQHQQQLTQAAAASSVKKHHDAPMTKRDLYFALACETVGIGHGTSAVARVTMVNWENQVVLDTFVLVPVPVTDFRTAESSIQPCDIYQNPQAMSFAQVRQAVDQILRGKILIGHNLQGDLTVLGLTHPWTDIRDTAFFQAFCGEEIDGVSHQPVRVQRSLDDLSWELLQRRLAVPGMRHRPVELCIATLDLYKTYRKDWEQDLIQNAQQKESQQQQRNAGAAAQSPPMYSPNLYLQPSMQHSHPMPPQRPRLPSYEMLSSARMEAYASIPSVPPPHQSVLDPNMPPSTEQQPITAAAPRGHRDAIQARNNASNSSWFLLGRKQRYSQAMAYQPPMASAPALSSQAMQVLSSHSTATYYDASTPYEGSSAYGDRSTLHDASTDYESSIANYDERSSVVSESVATESIASTLQEETDAQQDSASTDSPFQEQQTESSSWFRFGSRKSRYPQQHHNPMMAVEESEEPDEFRRPPSLDASCHPLDIPIPEEPPNTTSTSTTEQTVEEQPTVTYEPPRYFESEVVPKGKHSSWFGFRRSKSPGASCKREDSKSSDGKEEDSCGEPVGSSGGSALESVDDEQSVLEQDFDSCSPLSTTLPELTTSSESSLVHPFPPKTTLDSVAAEKASSWFSFRRSKSPSSKHPCSQEDSLSIERAALPPKELCDDTEDDWLQEVMNQPANEDDLHLAKRPGFESWVDGNNQELGVCTVPQFNEPNPEQSVNESDQQRHQQPTWFRFMRTPKTSSRFVSRLPSAASDGQESQDDRGSDDCLEQSPLPVSPFDNDNHNNISQVWFDEVVAGSIDSPCLGGGHPDWFGFGQVEMPSESPPIDMPSPDENKNDRMDFDNIFLRARLSTESTIPTVTTEDDDDMDEEDFSRDFVQGMEKNFSFLNI